MKGLVSIDLSQNGYSQSKISNMLGVTQPSINYYLKKGRKEYFNRLQKVGLSADSIREQENGFKDAILAGGSEGMLKAMQIMLNALASGEMCEYHKKVYHAPLDCDACMKLWGTGDSRERNRIIAILNKAVSVLETSTTFPLLIPEVNTNFVLSTRDAKSEKDVAGIEGRIVKYDRTIRDIMTSSGWRFYEIPSNKQVTPEKIPMLLDSILSEIPAGETRSSPDAIIHAGSIGLEASTYIFGADTDEVLRKVLDLSSAYASKRTETVHNRR